MNPAKAIYHEFIPESVRNPIGMLRRRIVDRWSRLAHDGPLPPPALLRNVQLTPFVGEFIRIGERSARSIHEALGRRLSETASVLDFGCGCGRTALPLSLAARWKLFGCDVDEPAVRWLASVIDPSRFRVNGARPPLPFDDDAFDAVYAVSVFTHFSTEEQRAWAKELARVLRPGGVAAITTMGAGIIENFPAHATPAKRATLHEEGVLFIEDSSAFNARAAFHTPGGLARLVAPEFDLWQHLERGLDGFQDLAVLVKR
ncbi:MAG: class I SAM-dependent methyltransferase [Thermoanaerobaculia bacterium]